MGQFVDEAEDRTTVGNGSVCDHCCRRLTSTLERTSCCPRQRVSQYNGLRGIQLDAIVYDLCSNSIFITCTVTSSRHVRSAIGVQSSQWLVGVRSFGSEMPRLWPPASCVTLQRGARICFCSLSSSRFSGNGAKIERERIRVRSSFRRRASCACREAC